MGRRRERSVFVSQVGARIRCLRFERNLTVAKLAQRSGLWEGHLEGIELGRIDLTLPTLRKIAEGLKVAPFDLLNCNHTTDVKGEFVEASRSWSKENVHAVLVFVRDRVARASLDEVEGAARSSDRPRGYERARRRRAPLRKVGSERAGPRTSAPPTA